MGSQFVDLNEDGHVDFLSATFDGSPHVAYGSEAGFAEPVHLFDRDGERVLISYIWDYEAKQHVVLDRAFGGINPPKERCISALAYDWDADGDFDLLLGSYENGHLYLQKNEGSNSEPAYTGRLAPVMAGEVPFSVPGKMTAPRLVDWDGDGDLDLLAGSFGSGDSVHSGGIYLALDVGAPGAPRFAALQPILPPQAKGGSELVRPEDGLYFDAVDHDGDGDLDLVVGGYSRWTPTSRELTGAESQQLERLQVAMAAVRGEQDKLMASMLAEVETATAGLEEGGDDWEKAYRGTLEAWRVKLKPVEDRVKELRSQLGDYVQSPRREAYIWLYERLGTRSATQHGSPPSTDRGVRR